MVLLSAADMSVAGLSPEADSLASLAAGAPDSVACQLYNNVCWKVRNSNPEVAIQYGAKAVKCAKRSENWEQLVKGYSYIGVCQRNLGNYSEALDYYTIGLDNAIKYNVKDQQGYGRINIANLYLYHDNYADAEMHLTQALDIANQLQDSAIMAYAYLNLGRVYIGLKDYDTAEKNLLRALEVREKCVRLNYQRIVVRKFLADCHSAAGNKEQAHDEYRTCLADKDIVGDYDLLSDITQKLAVLYYENGMLDSALSLGEQSLFYSKAVGSKFSIQAAYDIIGRIYFDKNLYKEAAENYASQIKYNDSIFNDQLAQKIFNIQFSAEQSRKQNEIDKLAQEKKIQNYSIYALILALLVGVGVMLIVLMNSRKVKRLNTKLEQQQQQITDSITYAQRIQSALLPDTNNFGKVFSDKFIFYRPRNVVSGDFYWHYDNENYEYIVVADCTGHGVPGAFMSMLGICALHDIVGNGNCSSAGEILNKLREMVKSLLHQTVESGQPKDGMDIAIMVVDKNTRILEYSGANIPLIYIRNGELKQIQPHRNPIGVYVKESPFQTQTLQLIDGDRIYVSSDGYSSQFGGPYGAKIKMGGYKDILLRNYQRPMEEQSKLLEHEFLDWMGAYHQIDDILVVGLKV